VTGQHIDLATFSSRDLVGRRSKTVLISEYSNETYRLAAYLARFIPRAIALTWALAASRICSRSSTIQNRRGLLEAFGRPCLPKTCESLFIRLRDPTRGLIHTVDTVELPLKCSIYTGTLVMPNGSSQLDNFDRVCSIYLFARCSEANQQIRSFRKSMVP